MLRSLVGSEMCIRDSSRLLLFELHLPFENDRWYASLENLFKEYTTSSGAEKRNTGVAFGSAFGFGGFFQMREPSVQAIGGYYCIDKVFESVRFSSIPIVAPEFKPETTNSLTLMMLNCALFSKRSFTTFISKVVSLSWQELADRPRSGRAACHLTGYGTEGFQRFVLHTVAIDFVVDIGGVLSDHHFASRVHICLLYTSPSPRDS